MKLLLDTHAFLELCRDPQSLPLRAREALEDAANAVYLSMASVWEMQIKSSLGKLRLARPVRDLVQFEIDRGALALLSIDLAHVAELAALPMIHRDPFDRLLIAQARREDLALITGDERIHAYEVACLWR